MMLSNSAYKKVEIKRMEIVRDHR